MEEPIADTLLSTADVLRWLGRYREANALVFVSRLLRHQALTSLEELEAFVVRLESAKGGDT